MAKSPTPKFHKVFKITGTEFNQMADAVAVARKAGYHVISIAKTNPNDVSSFRLLGFKDDIGHWLTIEVSGYAEIVSAELTGAYAQVAA